MNERKQLFYFVLWMYGFICAIVGFMVGVMLK